MLASAPSADSHSSRRAGAAAGTLRDPRMIGALVVGGFVGTVGRALLVDAWPQVPTTWPTATFAANLVGAFVLGVVVAVLRTRTSASLYWRPLLGTGVCGGLTTFSTLQLELVRMAEHGATGLAAAYLAASVAAGLTAVIAGLRLGERVPDVETVTTVDRAAEDEA